LKGEIKKQNWLKERPKNINRVNPVNLPNSWLGLWDQDNTIESK
jgi:hypothetical protein